MSVELLAVVLNHSKAKGTVKLVLIGIANHSGDGGAWPSVNTLAQYANTTSRTVIRALDKLVELREVRRHIQAGGLPEWADHTRPNRYDVLVTCPPYCDKTPAHRDTRPGQRGLWRTARPPDASVRGTPDASVTPPLTPVSPEPSSNQPSPIVVDSQLQDTRAREVPCRVCSRRYAACRKAARYEPEPHDYVKGAG